MGTVEYIGVGGIIIDDIVFPDGKTQMEVLGGGVVHSAAGMWIWDRRCGLVACAGIDLPASARRRLERDFDLEGLIMLDLPQARAWQLFEWDGRRSEVFRVDVLDPYIYEPSPEAVPQSYRQAKAVHLLRDAVQLPAWRALFPQAVLLWEPLQQYMIPDNTREFRSSLRHIDIVSPNWLEAQFVYGFKDPDQLLRAMLDDGAQIAVLRMGDAGSMVATRDELLVLPIIPVPQLVDQTGAGNAHCGGFLAGWNMTGDLLTAACYGGVAASFALEVIGVANPSGDWHSTRDERYHGLRDRVERRSWRKI
jgi:sugar/nucleoside kinase (ribokinase family)